MNSIILIKYTQEIQSLFKAVQLPREVAALHCKEQQRGDSQIHAGNRFADKAAQEVAQQIILLLIPEKVILLPEVRPGYSQADFKLDTYLQAQNKEGGWLVTPNNQVTMPPQLMLGILKEKHQQTHRDFNVVVTSLWTQILDVHMTNIVKSEKCLICL